MNDRDEILAAVHKIMLEMFEIDAGQVTLEARLYDDLDFDSIDAVDMIVKLKELTQRELKLEDFKTARTVGDVVESIFRIMNP
ncbi:MAG: acyl carrier protein [Methylovulum sp.]|uniref:acyl carrier protein n=1 Tax=Methylovulum sp. TaxID=1916980 RepID=UPI002604E241|nr:acyl carrier protein [Methylovulum sp.]MDD2724151.1 acyl carrier protein [Methylovulum sp.]MDD5123183.1 acyl carrier protein [Methylovulum sp.]